MAQQRYRMDWDDRWMILVEGAAMGEQPTTFLLRKKQTRHRRKTVMYVAQQIADLAQAYTDSAPAPNGVMRTKGGLRARGAGGRQYSGYPFPRAKDNVGRRLYRSSFIAHRRVIGNQYYAQIGNYSDVAAMVEYGSKGIRSRRTRITEAQRPNPDAPGQMVTYRKRTKGYYRIALKRSAYTRMVAETETMDYAERKRRGLPSVSPEYKAWQRYQASVNKGERRRVKQEYTNRWGTKVVRYRDRKVANINKIKKPKFVNGKRAERRMFITDKYGGPAVYTRTFQGYGPYAILQRAIIDGARMYLK